MTKKPVIGMVLFPNATQLDFTAPHEVFSRIPGVTIHILSGAPGPVKTERGLVILADKAYGDCPPLDVLFIPGGPGQMQAQDDPALISLIQRHGGKPECIIASVCTGALVLGVAGLLVGRKATTYWACMDLLPYMGAIPTDAPVVEDGPIMTGAGVTNGLDLALSVVEKLCGAPLRQRIARYIEYPHITDCADRPAIEALSRVMIDENPNRRPRVESAKKTAEKLGIKMAG